MGRYIYIYIRALLQLSCMSRIWCRCGRFIRMQSRFRTNKKAKLIAVLVRNCPLLLCDTGVLSAVERGADSAKIALLRWLWCTMKYVQYEWTLAEVPAVSLAGWRFGTQRPRFFSVDYRPTEAHSRDLRTGHLRFLSGDHSTPITLRCHFHTEQSGYSTFRVFSFRLRPFIGLHYVTSLTSEIHRIFLVVFPFCAISVLLS